MCSVVLCTSINRDSSVSADTCSIVLNVVHDTGQLLESSILLSAAVSFSLSILLSGNNGHGKDMWFTKAPRMQDLDCPSNANTDVMGAKAVRVGFYI